MGINILPMWGCVAFFARQNEKLVVLIAVNFFITQLLGFPNFIYFILFRF